MIKVLSSGLFTTIQDSGRIGYREYGVPLSGPMDAQSAKLSNALLGNDDHDAVMEITMTGPKLLFQCNTAMCITGAQINPLLNNERVPLNQMISVHTNDILSFGKLEYGVRAYLAVRGGFQTERIMGSRCMYPNITKQQQIKNNDLINIHAVTDPLERTYSSLKAQSSLFETEILTAFKGPEFGTLSSKLQGNILEQLFTVSKNNSRMGYQLEEPIKNDLKSLITGPVLPGTVQLTPSGMLVVLMRDCQTTGGYPRVLQLKETSINVLSQKRVGDSIRFQF